MTDERKDQLTAEADGLIEGRNAVIEALRVGTAIDKIYIAKGETDKTLGHIASRAREKGIVSVFCMGADAQGVTIEGGQYTVHDAVLTSSFPLGVSNHYVGNPVRVTVTRGSLLIALIEKE